MISYVRFFGVVLALLAPLAGHSQQSAFSLTLSAAGSGTNELGAVCENAAGNYVVAGYAFFGQQADITVAEINSQGVITQQNIIGNSSTELPYAIVQADAGYYILTGSVFDNFNDYDWFIAKLDASLQPVWMKRMGAVAGNDYANSVYEVSPDHFVITGTVGLSGSAKPSVVMIDSSGTVLDEGYLNTNFFASPNYRGRYLGNGEVAFSNLANAISVLDTTGTVVKQGAFNFATFTRDVQPADNGGYAMCGVAGYGSLQGAAVAFAITDSTLNTTPVLKRFNMSGYDLRAVAMERDLAGNYVVAVNALGLASGNSTPLLLRVDPFGNLIDSRSYLLSPFSNLSITALIHTSDDGFLIVGGDGFSAGFVTKIDSSGYCPFSSMGLSTSSLSTASSTPHAPFAGSISVINPQLSSTASGQINESVLCVLTGIEEDVNEVGLQVYPSVTDGELNIVLKNADGQSLVMEVISTSGELMMRKYISGRSVLDVSGLAQGVYLVRVTSLDASGMYTARFAKVSK